MSDANAPEPAPAVTAGPAPKKGGIGCLGVIAIIAGIFAVVLLVIGVLVWQAVSWIKNAPEPTISIADRIKLAPGEQEDASRIISQFDAISKNQGALVDESVTLNVINGIIQMGIEDEAKKNPQKPDAAVAARVSLKGDAFNARIVFPARDENGVVQPGMFINIDVDFDVEIVDGKFTKLEIQRVALGNKEAPLVARTMINFAVKGVREAKPGQDEKQKELYEHLKAFKLLKKEGERVHLVLDGKLLGEISAAENKPAPAPAPAAGSTAAEKTEP